MQRSRKRKQPQPQSHPSPGPGPPTKSAKIKANDEPFPSYHRPTPEECRAVRDDLLALHGFPDEFADYRSQRPNPPPPPLLNGSVHAPYKPVPGAGEEDSGSSSSKESVLDGLVSTILSQNTTDANSRRAFASLKSAFPTWEDVFAAESKSIENAIRCGGLAPTKASCIKNILSCLLQKKGKLCLEYLRDLSVDEIKAELSQFKGIGPKT
ncbi:DNA-(apurinic or apyrimidinic site) lyase, partial [Sarracenia purpurea var. burkii]